MTGHNRHIIFFFLALLVVSSVSEGHAAAGLSLGIFPRRPPQVTKRAFAPLAKYLEEQLNTHVQLQIFKNYTAFEKSLAQGDFDLVHLNHTQYLATRRATPYEAIVMNKEFGNSKLRGAIFVRADSFIHSVYALKGRKILFGGSRRAFIAYIVNTDILRQAGLKNTDYVEEFAINPPSAVIALSRGRASAAGAGDIATQLTMLKKSNSAQKVKILATSGPYPHLPWAVRKSMTSDTKKRIQSLLLSLNTTPTGATILAAAGLDGFSPANDTMYSPALGLIKRITGHPPTLDHEK